MHSNKFEECIGISRAGSNPADVAIFFFSFLRNVSIRIRTSIKQQLRFLSTSDMARIKTRRPKAPPEGYDKLAPTLTKLLTKLAEAQSASLTKEDKHSSLWPIIQINHQISRYVYTMYYKRKLISKELYDYLLTQKFVDADLIAKWKKAGYENLCCVRCIVTNETNHGNTCICRVPKSTLIRNAQEERIECITCGCKGCASTD